MKKIKNLFAIFTAFLSKFFMIEKFILNQIGAKDSLEFGKKMIEKIDRHFVDSKNHLLAGRLLDASMHRWPLEAFPELYTPIRKNIELPITWDGRLITGEFTTFLAPLRLSTATIEQAYNAVLKKAVNFFYITLSISIVVAILGGIGTYFSVSKISSLSEDRKQHYEYSNGYGTGINQSPEPTASTLTVVALGGVSSITSTFILLIGGILFSYAFASRRALNPCSLKGVIQLIIETDKILSTRTKESTIRWKWRQEERGNHIRAYRKQIILSNLDSSPRWRFGSGTGTALYRGALNGYMPGQEASLSFKDLQLNGLILGLTGSGKSFSILVPLLETIMREIRDTPLEKRATIALFLLDGKAVLVNDARKLAAKYGSKLRIIGCDTTEYGCDLLKGLPPEQAASLLSSIGQKGASNNDPLWSVGPTIMLHHALNIAQAWEVTPEGIEKMRETGERLYSPVGIFSLVQACRNPGLGLTHDVVKAIVGAARSSDMKVRNGILPFMTESLFESIKYVRQVAPSMPDGVIGSFIAQLSVVLADFSTNNRMRKSFGACSAEKMLDIDSIFDENTITCTTLSAATGGNAAFVTIKFIKSLTYRAAKIRNQLDPKIAEKSQLFTVLDEAQQIVTTEGDLGESEFLNVSRSTGCSIILATQSPAAFYAAFGEPMGGPITTNLLEQLRQKIILSAEGASVSDLIQNLAGTSLRSYIADNNKYESYLAARMESGESINQIEPLCYSDSEIENLVENHHNPERIEVQLNPLFEVDKRFIPDDSSSGISSMSPEAAMQSAKEALSAMRDATWRKEDKEQSSLLDGNMELPIYNKNDLLSLGQGQAICCVVVSGKSMTDIVRVDGPQRGRELQYDLSLMAPSVIEAHKAKGNQLNE